ncbi:MFS transporter [Cryptosporangium phraense]|uniref:MFS transporter n=1 Tax=Cryptosporangium phraense TaxID=2593070 RepID=A0A545AVI4_9ACTN|nr:MFS transporter [Cryptosporangium phraense]TQS45336.1 MFS transporter [Cryptosporangium phraense]
MTDRLTRARLPTPSSEDVASRRRELGWALRALCMTETVSYGVLYYAFPVLAGSITADTGWSVTAITADFSAALVVAGLAGVFVGRLLDRHGPRWVMTGASILGVVSVVVIATAPTFWVFTVGWLLAGVAMSGVFYPPAFTAVTVWFGPDRLRALTAITLLAGLASTIFAPLTAALNAHLSWRATYLVLAVVLAVLTVPAHLIALRPAWRHPEPSRAEPDAPDPESQSVDRGVFVLLAAAFTIVDLCVYATIVGTVPLIEERGFSTAAASWALGIAGLGQVLGRLGYARLARHVALRTRTVAIFGVSVITTALFAVLPGPYALLVVVSLVAGNARGLTTLLSATAISDRWGTLRYARLNGVFNAPLTIASAVAPFIGAGVAAVFGGYPAAFGAFAALGLVAVLLVIRRR